MSIFDPAHQETDRIIGKIEKEIAKEYKQAHQEVTAKLDDYLAKFKVKDEMWRAQVASGQKTKQEYIKWRKGQICIGQRWADLRDTLAQDYTNTAKIAQSIAKGYRPEVYALNHNYATFDIERKSQMNTSYTLYNAQAVERMYRDNPKLYHDPGKKTARDIMTGKQKAWDRRRIQSVLTQGILQGESITNLSKRLERVTGGDYGAAVRNMRTMMTGVQNAARIDAQERAKSMGIPVMKQWIATLDTRTRHWHAALDGQTAETDEPFNSEFGDIMYPGDPSADPANIYNCFLGDVSVAADSDVVRSYKHDYSGNVYSIKTSTGVNFTCTPNHPILTDRGWVRAQFLNKGDNLLITDSRKLDMLRIDPNVDHTFSTFETVHKTLDKMGGKRATSLHVNFHGDIPASDVEIITQKRFLRIHRDARRRKCIDKLSLVFSNKSFTSKSAFMKHFMSVITSTFGFIGGMCKTLSFFWRGVFHASKHGFGTIPDMNSVLFKTKHDNFTGNAKIGSDLQDGFSGCIFPDNIVDIKIFTVSHTPVYNLQTKNGYYFVNTIIPQNGVKYNGNTAIAHNCRCSILNVIKGFEIDIRDGRVSYDNNVGSLSYDEWKAGHYTMRSDPIRKNETIASALRAAERRANLPIGQGRRKKRR